MSNSNKDKAKTTVTNLVAAQMQLISDDTTLSEEQKARGTSVVKERDASNQCATQARENARSEFLDAIAAFNKVMEFKPIPVSGKNRKKAPPTVGGRLFGQNQNDPKGKSNFGVNSVPAEFRYRYWKKVGLLHENAAESIKRTQMDWLEEDFSTEKSIFKSLNDPAALLRRPWEIHSREEKAKYHAATYDNRFADYAKKENWVQKSGKAAGGSYFIPWTEFLANQAALDEDKRLINIELFKALLNDEASPQRRAFDLAVQKFKATEVSCETAKKTSESLDTATNHARVLGGLAVKKNRKPSTTFGTGYTRSAGTKKVEARAKAVSAHVAKAKKWWNLFYSAARSCTTTRDSHMQGFQWCCDIIVQISGVLEKTPALVWAHDDKQYTLTTSQTSWRHMDDNRSYCDRDLLEWHKRHVEDADRCTFKYDGDFRLYFIDGELKYREPQYAAVRCSNSQDIDLDMSALNSRFPELYRIVAIILEKAVGYADKVHALPLHDAKRESLGLLRWDPMADKLHNQLPGMNIRHLPRPVGIGCGDDNPQYPDDGYSLCSEFRVQGCPIWWPFSNNMLYALGANGVYEEFEKTDRGELVAPRGCWRPEDETTANTIGFDHPGDERILLDADMNMAQLEESELFRPLV